MGVFIRADERRCQHRERPAQQRPAHEHDQPEGGAPRQQHEPEHDRRKQQPAQNKRQHNRPAAGIIDDILQRGGGVAGLAVRAGQRQGGVQAAALRGGLHALAGPEAERQTGLLIRKAVGRQHKLQRFVGRGGVGGVKNQRGEGVVQQLDAGHGGLRDRRAVRLAQLRVQRAGGKGVAVGRQVQAHAVQRLPGAQRHRLGHALQTERLAVFIVDDLVDRLAVHPGGQVEPRPGEHKRPQRRQQHTGQRQTMPPAETHDPLHSPPPFRFVVVVRKNGKTAGCGGYDLYNRTDCFRIV